MAGKVGVSPDTYLKNFLRGMETNGGDIHVGTPGFLKNFLRGMETSRQSATSGLRSSPQKLP